MNMKSIRRELRAKGEDVKKVLASWRTYVPNHDHYFVDDNGSIRRHDVKAAGGRRAFRSAQREKRQKRIAELKARRTA